MAGMRSGWLRQSREASRLGQLLVSVALGALLALLSSLIPVIVLIGVALVIASVWVLLLRAPANTRLIHLSGLSLGSGGAFLYATASTIWSCAQTDDFCGGANVVPLLVVSVLAIATGVAGVTAAYRRTAGS